MGTDKDLDIYMIPDIGHRLGHGYGQRFGHLHEP
jgi:hypothetical protein